MDINVNMIQFSQYNKKKTEPLTQWLTRVGLGGLLREVPILILSYIWLVFYLFIIYYWFGGGVESCVIVDVGTLPFFIGGGSAFVQGPFAAPLHVVDGALSSRRAVRPLPSLCSGSAACSWPKINSLSYIRTYKPNVRFMRVLLWALKTRENDSATRSF